MDNVPKLYTLEGNFIEKQFPSVNFTGIVEWEYSWDYFLNGAYYRIGEPAVIQKNKKYKDQYWIDDKQVTKEQHDLYVDLLKLKKLL